MQTFCFSQLDTCPTMNKKIKKVKKEIITRAMSSALNEEGEPPPPYQMIPKPKQNTQKKIWLLTYCPSGTYITAEMLQAQGINVEECHSTCDRVMNYTYLNFTQRCRLPFIEKMLSKLQTLHGIVKNEVFGYESIGSMSNQTESKRLQDHIVFQMLLKHCNENNPSFSPNTEGERVLKKGYLFQACGLVGDKTIALENQTKAQVIKYARTLEEKIRKYQDMEEEMKALAAVYKRVSDERSVLYHETVNLKRRIDELQHVSQPGC